MHTIQQSRGQKNIAGKQARFALSNDQLRAVCPSIFATEPWAEVSDQYRFIPTIDVVEKMRTEGFVPVEAIQSRSRIEGKGDFTKHMVRFQRSENLGRTDLDIVPEIAMVNAHDRTSTYKLYGGIWRLICHNGLIAQSDVFGSVNVRHSGPQDIIGDVIEGSFKIIENATAACDRAGEFSRIQLQPQHQHAMALAAASLRWEPIPNAPDGKAFPIAVGDLLKPRRWADMQGNDQNNHHARSDVAKPDLWTTFNVIQENLLKGGVKGHTTTGGRMTTRQVKSVGEDLRLNRSLWVLAEELAKIAA